MALFFDGEKDSNDDAVSRDCSWIRFLDMLAGARIYLPLPRRVARAVIRRQLRDRHMK